MGVDFSPALLAEARRQVKANAADAAWFARFDFRAADFSTLGWETDLQAASFAGVLCFAVLHHLPGSANRAEFLCRAAGLLRAGGQLWLSVWQFQHSARLAARQVPWQRVGLSDADVEPGDTLLDWRRTPDGVPALRYVHRFDPVELAGLAQDAGLSLHETFESDGEGGRLGLYSGWVK
jgi:SAM-dependent methyltransferase